MKRDISKAALRVCFGAVRKEITPSKLLNMILEELASNQRDLDVTGDMDDAYYYMGVGDTLERIAHWIAPLKQDKEPAYNLMVDRTGTIFPETETPK